MTIIDFNAAKDQKRRNLGEDGVMTCACQIQEAQPMGFLPVLIHDTLGVIVAGLACAACGCGYEVQNGRLIEDAP